MSTAVEATAVVYKSRSWCQLWQAKPPQHAEQGPQPAKQQPEIKGRPGRHSPSAPHCAPRCSPACCNEMGWQSRRGSWRLVPCASCACWAARLLLSARLAAPVCSLDVKVSGRLDAVHREGEVEGRHRHGGCQWRPAFGAGGGGGSQISELAGAAAVMTPCISCRLTAPRLSANKARRARAAGRVPPWRPDAGGQQLDRTAAAFNSAAKETSGELGHSRRCMGQVAWQCKCTSGAHQMCNCCC